MGKSGDERRGLTSRMVRGTGRFGASFAWRWFTWTLILGVIATVVAQATWPAVYSQFGLPLGIGEEGAYKAVQYGVLVTSLFGGAFVAFVGTVRAR